MLQVVVPGPDFRIFYEFIACNISVVTRSEEQLAKTLSDLGLCPQIQAEINKLWGEGGRGWRLLKKYHIFPAGKYYIGSTKDNTVFYSLSNTNS